MSDLDNFQNKRNVKRQRQVAHIYAAGPRPVLEALLDVPRGSLSTTFSRTSRASPFRSITLSVPTSFRSIGGSNERGRLTKALRGKWHGSYGTARCPAHPDKTPSLSISIGRDGRTLVRCHTGCSQEQVIDALRRLRLWGGDVETQPPRVHAGTK